MNESAQNSDGDSRLGVPTIVVILLLVIATVGGSLSFLWDRFIVTEYAVPVRGVIERFEVSGTPSIQIELKAASTVSTEGFSQEMTDPSGKPLFISDKAGMTSADVKAAAVVQVEENFVIEVEFTEAGAKKLTKLSRELVVKDRDTATERLAILLDGKLNGAPAVLEVIDGGSAQIHLNQLTKLEAMKLAKGIVGSE